MPRRLIRLLRLLVATVALLQGVTPAAASVAEGVLAGRGRASPTAVHMEDGRQATCAFAHPGDCAICGCVSTFPLAELARAPLATAPLRLVPPGDRPAAHAGGRWSPARARAPPHA